MFILSNWYQSNNHIIIHILITLIMLVSSYTFLLSNLRIILNKLLVLRNFYTEIKLKRFLERQLNQKS